MAALGFVAAVFVVGGEFDGWSVVVFAVGKDYLVFHSQIAWSLEVGLSF